MWKHFVGSFVEPGAAQLTVRRVLVEGGLLLALAAASSWLVWR
jgi:hypothetical protein